MEILRDRSTELEFKLDLQGNAGDPTVGVFLEMGNHNLYFRGKVDGDTAKVTIPALDEVAKSLPESAKLNFEVIVDGAYFIPFEEKATFKQVLKVDVKEAVTREEEKPKVMAEYTSRSHGFVPERPVVKAKVDMTRVNQFLSTLHD